MPVVYSTICSVDVKIKLNPLLKALVLRKIWPSISTLTDLPLVTLGAIYCFVSFTVSLLVSFCSLRVDALLSILVGKL